MHITAQHIREPPCTTQHCKFPLSPTDGPAFLPLHFSNLRSQRHSIFTPGLSTNNPLQATTHLMSAIEEFALGLDPGHVPQVAQLLLVLGHQLGSGDCEGGQGGGVARHLVEERGGGVEEQGR